ncbi:MAG: nucleoside-diphosphate sugar epimerase, partial [Planctomycetota bacterium]
VYGKGFEDIHTRIPDITKLHRFVEYRRKYSLDDILHEVIAEKRKELGL